MGVLRQADVKQRTHLRQSGSSLLRPFLATTTLNKLVAAKADSFLLASTTLTELVAARRSHTLVDLGAPLGRLAPVHQSQSLVGTTLLQLVATRGQLRKALMETLG